MAKPPPWPDRPGNSQSFDRFWLVRGLPPQPFPQDDYDYGSDPRFGPAGTRWVFTLEQLYNRETEFGVSAATKAAIERLFRKLAIKLPPLGSTSWATPYSLERPASEQETELGVSMHWVRTQVIGVVGTDEEVVHVHNWRSVGTENADIDAAGVKAIGTAVRDAWAAFIAAQKTHFGSELRYTEVRSSLLVQDAPATKPTWPLPTQVTPFAAGVTGTSATLTLPYEVALGLSLNTNFRGTSRFRGRTYLGPLSSGLMYGAGKFDAGTVDAIGASFGNLVVAGVKTAANYELHVVSQKYGTSAAVTGVRVGVVPDSQRRRRKSQVEAYFQAWGTPVGAL